MAPEQIHKSKNREIDGRADIYALGVTMYQMLAGEVPFDSDDTSVILDMHRHTPIPSVREKNAGVPTRVADLIGKAMAKSPSARYQSAKAMRQEIEAIAEEKDIILEHIEPPEPLWKQIGRLIFYWPLPRWGPVIENIWAAFLYSVLATVIGLIAWWVWGITDFSVGQIAAAFSGPSSTPIAAVTETPTFTPTITRIPTHTHQCPQHTR